MSNIEVKHLLRQNRFTENEWKFVSLLLYIPLGIILFILRGILVLSVVVLGCVFPDTPMIHKLINKIACVSMGISVTVENPEKKENVEVFVSNNVSVLDQMVVHSVTGSVSPGKKLHPTLARSLGITHFDTGGNLEAFKKNVAAAMSEKKCPIYFTPEGKITNGKALLKFKTYPFSFSSKVQPITICISRPFLDIAVYSLGSPFWVDLFYYMFSPLTNYKLRFLPPLDKKSLSDEEFAEIVRQNIAGALKVETVDISESDLSEYEKRQIAEQNRLRAEQTARENVGNTTRRMALQVKEVLPHVPLDAIYRDLYRTRNVDSTITNILEGRVAFTPEVNVAQTPERPSAAAPSTSAASHSRTVVSSSVSFNTAAATFPKSAQDRIRSFQERKQQLIASARKRYIEKHNLDIPC